MGLYTVYIKKPFYVLEAEIVVGDMRTWETFCYYIYLKLKLVLLSRYKVKGTADVTWYHENSRIELDLEKGRVKTEVNVDNVHTLIVSNVTRSDRGNYICSAENAAGRVTTHCIVTVVNDPSEVDIDPWMDPGYPRFDIGLVSYESHQFDWA
jgi:hypothetical protein